MYGDGDLSWCVVHRQYRPTGPTAREGPPPRGEATHLAPGTCVCRVVCVEHDRMASIIHEHRCDIGA